VTGPDDRDGPTDGPDSVPLSALTGRSRGADGARRSDAPGVPPVDGPHSLPIAETRPAVLTLTGTPEPAEPGRSRWPGRLFWGGLALLVGGGLALAVQDWIGRALSAGDWLAWLPVAGLGLLAVGLAAAAIREWLGLASVDALRAARASVALAEEGADARTTDRVIRDLKRLHKGRRDLEWAWRRYDEAAAGAGDAEARLALVERLVIRPLDDRARRATQSAIRRTAMVTAITPFPVLDMVVTLAIDLGLVRRIARIYGGRPGVLGGWRLLRLSLASVLASGALDLTDDAIGGALGAGIAARLSRRAGVGLLNGLLTARLAAAAMDLGRPFPWGEGRPPSARRLLAQALSQFERGSDPAPPDDDDATAGRPAR
jgi:putative membrane protein